MRRQFGRVLQDVSAKGNRFVVERRGEPVAAVVPIEIYDEWKRARNTLFSRIRATSKQANMTPDEASSLADDAVKAVRSGK